MRSTIEFQLFDRVRLRSIGSIAEPVRLTSSGHKDFSSNFQVYIKQLTAIVSNVVLLPGLVGSTRLIEIDRVRALFDTISFFIQATSSLRLGSWVYFFLGLDVNFGKTFFSDPYDG